MDDSPFDTWLLVSWAINLVGMFSLLAGGIIFWLRLSGGRRVLQAVFSIALLAVGFAATGNEKLIGAALAAAALALIYNCVVLPGEIRRRPKELLAPAILTLVGILCLLGLFARKFFVE